jgi:hypothetical protein
VAGELGIDLHRRGSTGTVKGRSKLKRQDNLSLFARTGIWVFDVIVDLRESGLKKFHCSSSANCDKISSWKIRHCDASFLWLENEKIRGPHKRRSYIQLRTMRLWLKHI